MQYKLYNNSLCPDLWKKNPEGSYDMRPNIVDRLMEIANDFADEYLKESNIKLSVEDVVIIGSIANYNWNSYSDIDLHLVFDYSKLDMSEEDAFTMLSAIKTNWNKAHDIMIKGHDLEIGVQGVDQEVHSDAAYSVKNKKWISEPKMDSPKFDKKSIKKKHSQLKKKIELLLKNHDDDGLRDILAELYDMRQKGLDKSGEFSAENIVFKILRAQGYLDKIKEHANSVYDKEMTIKEAYQNLSSILREIK
jgi:predicted nucleotidyltransferase